MYKETFGYNVNKSPACVTGSHYSARVCLFARFGSVNITTFAVTVLITGFRNWITVRALKVCELAPPLQLQ
jgi:hypothetical protein